jgi:hypothetical protein
MIGTSFTGFDMANAASVAAAEPPVPIGTLVT